jgi:hypothetical protein
VRSFLKTKLKQKVTGGMAYKPSTTHTHKEKKEAPDLIFNKLLILLNLLITHLFNFCVTHGKCHEELLREKQFFELQDKLATFFHVKEQLTTLMVIHTRIFGRNCLKNE